MQHRSLETSLTSLYYLLITYLTCINVSFCYELRLRCRNLIPITIVLGQRAFGRGLFRSRELHSHELITVPIGGTAKQEDVLSSFSDLVYSVCSGSSFGLLPCKKTARHHSPDANTLALDFLASNTLRKEMPVLIKHSFCFILLNNTNGLLLRSVVNTDY